MLQTDVLIIGTGIAGATAALQTGGKPQPSASPSSRASPTRTNPTPRYAQGGIISRGPDDSADLLVKDILEAGAGASLPSAARILAEEGPALLEKF